MKNKRFILVLILFVIFQIEERHAETIVHCTCENGGISSFLLEFEKFISKQEVAVFSQKVDLSK